MNFCIIKCLYFLLALQFCARKNKKIEKNHEGTREYACVTEVHADATNMIKSWVVLPGLKWEKKNIYQYLKTLNKI